MQYWYTLGFPSVLSAAPLSVQILPLCNCIYHLYFNTSLLMNPNMQLNSPNFFPDFPSSISNEISLQWILQPNFLSNLSQTKLSCLISIILYLGYLAVTIQYATPIKDLWGSNDFLSVIQPTTSLSSRTLKNLSKLPPLWYYQCFNLGLYHP